MTKAEREEKLRKRLIELKEYENDLYAKGARFIGGVDEVGRGPLAGPVVAACVVLPADFDVLGVDDSKKLSEKKREELFHSIRSKALAWGVGTVGPETIDEINILQATKRAMREGIRRADEMLMELAGERTDYIIIDGLKIDGLEKSQLSLIKGDQKSVSVAAASILAKVTRDRLMIEYDEKYPGYAFARNKGYGTKAHYEGIEKLGITSIHRRSFLEKLDLERSGRGGVQKRY